MSFLSCRRVFASKCFYSQFKSAYNADSFPQLHPLPNPPSGPSDDPLDFNGYIPVKAINKSFSRSSGPGGQNVNTVATKTSIRFHVQDADWLSTELKTKLASKWTHRINAKGELVVTSERTRVQSLNLADCFDKLRTELHKCALELRMDRDREQTFKMDRERFDRRHERNVQLRLLEKRRNSDNKRNRSADNFDII